MHNSIFSENHARALAIVDHARVLVNASTISSNSVHGDGGGLSIEGDAIVTIIGSSTVHGNKATQVGGGLVARGRAVLKVTGNSNVPHH
jgi:hypothetical protein